MRDELTDPSSLVGRTIAGKFLLEELKGRGSMGEVYRARHLQLDQRVAVKVMARVFAKEPTFAARFEREAKASFALAHPNVIRVIDFGTENGAPYLAMEYIDGGDLAGIIEHAAPLPVERILSLMRQALAGIAAAHDAGIVHRDLKPENILIIPGTNDVGQPTELVKVCDFGIAMLGEPPQSAVPTPERGAKGTRRLTETGIVIGTPEYMSPEQARAEPVDARTDVYAMGVVLYEMLTGRVPFVAPTPMGILAKQITEEPLPPSEIIRSVEPRLEQICLQALQKDRTQRFQSARDMRAALGELIGLDEPSTRTTAPHRPVRATATALSVANPGPQPPTLVTRIAAPASPLERVGGARTILAALAVVAALVVGSVLGSMSHPAASRDARDSSGVAAAVAAPPPVAPSTLRDLPAPVASSDTPSTLSAKAASPTSASIPVATTKPVRPVKGAPNGIAAVAPPASEPAGGPANVVPDPLPVAAVVAEPAPVVAAAPPPPPPPPPAPVPVPAAAPPAPSIDPALARVTLTAVSDIQGARKSDAQSAFARVIPKMTACYQTDLRGGASGAVGGGTLHIETDDTGKITIARAQVPLSSAGARCVEGLAIGVVIPNVDTGQAAADLALSFRLQ